MNTENKVIIKQFFLLLRQIVAELMVAEINADKKAIETIGYRRAAIKRVIAILQSIDFKITAASQLANTAGIGASSLARIQEILSNGFLSELDAKYTDTELTNIREIICLKSIINVGPAFVKHIIMNHNIHTVAQLQQAVKDGTIQVNRKIALGLKYYGIVKANIPRSETHAIAKYFSKIAHIIDPQLSITACGSYRRGKSTSGDIDMLLHNPHIKTSKHQTTSRQYLVELVDVMRKNGTIIDSMTPNKYDIKFMGFIKYKKNPVRRIDIRYVPHASLAAAMLYFTGPYELNRAMRRAAIDRNLLLNEYGIFKIRKDGTKKIMPTQTEQQIFEILAMDYLPPELRENYNTTN